MKAIFILLIGLAPLGAAGQAMDSLATVKVVDSLLTAARGLINAGKFQEALPLAQQAAEISKQKWGENNARYATSIHRQAFGYASLGQNDKAEELYLKAIDLRAKVLGKQHSDYAWSLSNLGVLYVNKGDYDKAEPIFLEVKEIFAKSVGIEHEFYADVLGNLASVYYYKGDYAKEEPLLLESKDIRAKIFGKESEYYALSLNTLAVLYYNKGDYHKAEPMYLEAMKIREKTLGKEHPVYAESLMNLAILYQVKGDYAKAEPLYKEVAEIWTKSYGIEHTDYARVLNGLGTLYQVKGDYAKAESLYLKSAEIWAKVSGKDHRDYAVALDNLGGIYHDKGDYNKAELRYLESNDIWAKVFGREHPEYALNLANLGGVYYAKGDYVKAEMLLLESEKIVTKNFGKEHPDYVLGLKNQAVLYRTTNRIPEATALFLEMNDLNRRLIEKSAAYSSESQMLAYLNTFEEQNDQFQSFAQTYPSSELNRATFDNALFFNGLLLENARSLSRSIASADSLTRDAYERWQGCRRRLSNEYAKPIAERRYVTEVEAEAEGYEKTLTRNLAAFGETRKVPHWQDVQATLTPGEAAVEFIHYRYYTPKATDSTLYAALVLRPGDTEPKFIPLFEEKELTPLLRGAAGGSNFLKINALYTDKSAGSKYKSLYELIWQPLESLLAGTKTVYCSPSSLLHRINLAAIQTNGGQVFDDHHQLVLLGSTRQLVVRNNLAQSSTNDAYLAGGIRYDTDSTAIAYANRSASGSRSIEQPSALAFQPDSLSATRGGVLDYLPATAAEVREIGQTLSATGFRAKVDTGFYATEEAFRQLGVGASSPRIVHLATHGYFFPDPVSKGQRANSHLGQEPVFKLSDHPMIRSGLIMAGAKQAWLTGKHPQGQEDGILTAYEISQMNLSGTELVVLSACETGLGDIMGNEGVYGLQRAFKIAGAKYLVMSLWKVDDRSTQEFMTAFYRHWLMDKQPVPQAFRAAQREQRAKHPGAYDWAGFVLIE